MLGFTLAVAFASAYMAPTTLQSAITRTVVSPSADVQMFLGGSRSAPKKQAVQKGSKGKSKVNVERKASFSRSASNVASFKTTTKDPMRQKSGFGNFVQKFQLAAGKSKYGVPIYLPNGNINPAYLAAERKEMATRSKANVSAERAKTKKMRAAGTFELAQIIAKKVGNVGSDKDYYASGR